MAILTIKHDENGNPIQSKCLIIPHSYHNQYIYTKGNCYAPIMSLFELCLIITLAVPQTHYQNGQCIPSILSIKLHLNVILVLLWSQPQSPLHFPVNHIHFIVTVYCCILTSSHLSTKRFSSIAVRFSFKWLPDIFYMSMRSGSLITKLLFCSLQVSTIRAGINISKGPDLYSQSCM